MLDARCTSRDIQRFQSRAWNFIVASQRPLAEGLQAVPRDSRGRRSWSKMADDQIVDYARELMDEKGITGRKELDDTDRGVYLILRKRRLLDRVGFVGRQKKRRSWKGLSDEEIVEFTQKWMKEKRIARRGELFRVDHGLYEILRIRRLLGKIEFVEQQKKRKYWIKMSDEEVVRYARKIVERKGIRKRDEFQRNYRGIYSALWKRGLLDEVGFEERKKERSWKDKSSDEIVDIAQKFMRKRGITGRRELAQADQGLYEVLRNRRLMDNVGFEVKRRKGRQWKDLGDEEIVDIAKNTAKEKDITARDELKKADSGLYEILRKRGLLDSAFAHIEQQREDTARDAVIDALTKFAADDGETEVEVT